MKMFLILPTYLYALHSFITAVPLDLKIAFGACFVDEKTHAKRLSFLLSILIVPVEYIKLCLTKNPKYVNFGHLGFLLSEHKYGISRQVWDQNISVLLFNGINSSNNYKVRKVITLYITFLYSLD